METVAEMLGVEYPIIMGALGSLGNPELVAAVSEGGGFGLIGTAGMDLDKLRESISKVRELTDKPFGVNLMALNPDAPAMVEVLAEADIKAVTTSAGSPKKLTPVLHDAGIKALHVIPSPPLALNSFKADLRWNRRPMALGSAGDFILKLSQKSVQQVARASRPCFLAQS